jgi:hypothetical protein
LPHRHVAAPQAITGIRKYAVSLILKARFGEFNAGGNLDADGKDKQLVLTMQISFSLQPWN